MSTHQNPTPDDPKRRGATPDHRETPPTDDGLLDSIGKAITDPVTTGAEDEEPREDGSVPQSPGR